MSPAALGSDTPVAGVTSDVPLMDPKHHHHLDGSDQRDPPLSKEAFLMLLRVLMVLKGNVNI